MGANPQNADLDMLGASRVLHLPAPSDPTEPARYGDQFASLPVTIDGGGSAITTGLKGWLEVPANCTIQAATLLADQTGSIVVDVYRCTYAQYAPGTHPVAGDKITGSAPPTISSAAKAQDTTLTGWTTSLSKGDVLAFNVNSASTITKVALSLRVLKT